MVIVCENHSMNYEAQRLAMLFVAGEKLTEAPALTETEEDYILTALKGEGANQSFYVCAAIGGETAREELAISQNPDDWDYHRAMGVCMYKALQKLTGKTPPWGILTGIRPVKLMRGKLKKGMSKQQVTDMYTGEYLVHPQKVALALKTAAAEESIIRDSIKGSYSLYVSIPFCPTRCNYCSFVSQAIGTPKAKQLIQPYVEKLCVEIEHTAAIANRLGLTLQTVYFGGGTPTTLTANQLTALCDTIARCFDLSSVNEYTVEAGRPDTIDRGKLEALKKAGVGRISINPQTLNDDVLRAIGRSHTAEDIRIAYTLAREVGFDCINMDLIAGLETDTLESFTDTLNQVTQLAPENVTVHTLAVKRAAELGGKKQQVLMAHSKAGQMVDTAHRSLEEAGYIPYYLYRQKNTLDNLENVGYSKLGKECRYNVLIMEEVETILAVGAGGVTKLCDGENVKRIYNYKFPFEYIGGFDEMLRRKSAIEDFYTLSK